MRPSSFRFLGLGIVTATSWLALAACRHDGSSNEHDAALNGSSAENYRAVLLPYEAKGWEAVAASPTPEGWMVAMHRTEQLLDEDTGVEIWTIEGGKTTKREPIRLSPDEAAKMPCPDDGQPQIRSVKAFAVDGQGAGLLLVAAGCKGFGGGGGILFERRDGTYRMIDWPSDVPGTSQNEIACGGGGCAWLFNEGEFPAAFEGSSSISVALFRDGAWTSPLHERETADDETFLVSGIAAMDESFVVTGWHSKGDGVTAPVEDALAFNVTANGSTPIDVPGHSWFTAPVATAGLAVFGAQKNTKDGAVLGVRADGSVTTLAMRDAASVQGLTNAVLLGEHVVEEQNVDLSVGYDNAMRIDGNPLAFPIPTSSDRHALVQNAAVRGHEALFFGSQFATKTSSPNVVAPLFVLVTDDTNLVSAEPLPVEILDDSCDSPKDCADKLPWGIKCSGGYFSCQAHVCGRVCEMGRCGNQVCDVEEGETKESCGLDCR